MATGYFRGEGGSIWEMDLPLPDHQAEKVTKGYLVQVNADGSPYVKPAGDPTPAGVPTVTTRPAVNAPKAEWVGWAVHNGMAPDDAEAKTKAELVDQFGRDGEE